MNQENGKPIQLTDGQLEALLTILAAAIQAARDVEEATDVSSDTGMRERFALMLHHSLIEKVDSVLLLASAGKSGGVEVIARSTFESYIDMINLRIHRERYPSYLLYISTHQWGRILNAVVRENDSPYSKSIVEHAPRRLGQTVEEMLAENLALQAELSIGLGAEYRAKGKKPVRERKVAPTVAHRAKLAGKTDEYESIYRMSSHAVDGSISSTLGAFVKDGETTWPPQAVPLPSSAIVLATRYLLESTWVVAKMLGKPSYPMITITNRLDEWESTSWGEKIES